MVLHLVQTSLIVSILFLFSFRLCINVITSDFFESGVKLSIRNPLVGKFAWNEAVNDLLLLCTFKRKYECPFHRYIETQVRRKGDFSHFSWVVGSTTNFKPTMLSLSWHLAMCLRQKNTYLRLCEITCWFSFIARQQGGDLTPCLTKSQSLTSCESF